MIALLPGGSRCRSQAATRTTLSARHGERISGSRRKYFGWHGVKVLDVAVSSVQRYGHTEDGESVAPKPNREATSRRSSVEQEVANVAVLHHVGFAFDAEFARRADVFFRLVGFQVF